MTARSHKHYRIALDAMGGDFAPVNLVEGGVMALKQYHDLEIIFVGDESAIKHELAKYGRGAWKERLSIKHASQVVTMSDPPAEAVRRKKDSSINRAVELIKDEQAQAVVSAGNTGALVAASTIRLRALPGIDRPGIATILPTQYGNFLLIDAGANIEPTPEHLVGYAVMGSIYAKEVMGYANPRVGLISIGSEAGKGNEFTKETFKLLKETTVNFVGNIEGHALFNKPVEVVVCDGFVGNVILKTAESLATSIFKWLKDELSQNPIRQAGALMAKDAFVAIRKKTNTEEYGGMPLLGVNGICIKAHGNSSALAIKNALRVAREAVALEVNRRIIAAMAKNHEQSKAPATPAS